MKYQEKYINHIKSSPFAMSKTPAKTRLLGRSGEKAQPMRPAAQMIDPMKIKAGRGRRSAKKPEGSAKIDSKMPRTKPKLLRPPDKEKLATWHFNQFQFAKLILSPPGEVAPGVV